MGRQVPSFLQIIEVQVCKIQTFRQFCFWVRIERFVFQCHLQCISCRNLVRATTLQWFGPKKWAVLFQQLVPSGQTAAALHQPLSAPLAQWPAQVWWPQIQMRACSFVEA